LEDGAEKMALHSAPGPVISSKHVDARDAYTSGDLGPRRSRDKA
jgi:hypothetical protein